MKYSLDFWRPAFHPAREFTALQKGINSLFDDVFPAHKASRWEAAEFQPECDVEETENEFKMSFDIPGMKKDEIKIEIADNHITVRGDRQEENKEESKNRKVYERRYGKFERTFTLPGTIDSNKVEATYDKGVLNLTVPKEGAAKPKQIAVKECHIERNAQKKEARPQPTSVSSKQAV